MRKLLATTLLLATAGYYGVAHAQFTPRVHATWPPVTTQADGTVIDGTDVSYVVYNSETEIPVCATQDVECYFDIAWGDCITLHATAKQLSTSLESSPSNSVNVCSGTRPDFPLSAPVITVTIEDSPA